MSNFGFPSNSWQCIDDEPDTAGAALGFPLLFLRFF